MSSSNRAFDGLRAVLLADVLRVTAKGLVILALSRVLLSPDEYGLLFLTLSVLTIVLLFGRLGFEKSTARYVAEYGEREPGQIPHILRTGAIYISVTTVTAAIALIFFRDWIAALIGEPALGPLLLVGIAYLIGRTLESFSSAQLQGFNRVELSAVIGATDSLAQPLLVIGFVVLGFGVAGALFGFALSALLGGLVGVVILYTKFYRRREPAEEIESGLRERLFRYSVPLTFTRGSNVIDKRIDIVLIGVFLTPAAVGFYTLAKQITEFVISPAKSLGFTVSPSYGEQKASDDLERAARTYELTFTHTVALVIPAAAGLIIVAEPAVRLVFGEAYVGAAPALQVLSGLVVVQSLDKITNDGLDYLGRARERAIAKGVAAVVNIVLNLIFIPLFGIVGAAAATVISYSILVAVELYVMYDELPLDVGRLTRATGMVGVVTGGMSLAVFVLVPHVSGLASLFAVIFAGVLVWAVLAELSGVLDLRRIVSAIV